MKQTPTYWDIVDQPIGVPRVCDTLNLLAHGQELSSGQFDSKYRSFRFIIVNPHPSVMCTN
jgi:hypothetical protein